MRNLNFLKKLGLIAATAGACLLSACGGGSGSSASSQGTLQVAMTDAPSCGFDQVNVTVSKVRVNQSTTAGDTDAGWQEITLSPAPKINLVTLTNGVLQTLGQTSLPAGHYTQLRLVLAANDANSATLANSIVKEGTTTEIAIETPSAIQSGIKLNSEFDVAAGATTDLALDFDACKSIVTKGNGGYLLKPVIAVTPQMISGGITGYITPGTTKATVTAQQNGVVVKSTVPDATTGAFTLSPLLASGATDYVVVITADGRTSAAISGIPVLVSANTTLSTSTAPIALPVSAVHAVSGTITAPSSTAPQGTARALQTFASSGPTVEIAFKSADATTNAYAMPLPVAAPLLGKFGTGTLPVAFTADSTIAGKYTIEASATGFATQTFSADASIADVTKDFALVP